MFKRFVTCLCAIVLCLALTMGTAVGDLNIIYKGNDSVIYGAVEDTGGYVVNFVPAETTVSEQVQYSLTPLDVVIVIDTSGSMNVEANSGKSLLGFSTEAAEKFVDVLMAVNPSSRIGIVEYSDSAMDVLPLTGLNDQAAIGRALNGLNYRGSTNQTDGFRHAADMLSGKRPEAQGMVLLLTDGCYNVGGHPGNAGYSAAAKGLVYTVGLVGNLSPSEKSYVRDGLACGYETRYFEVDFNSMDDAGLNNLAMNFMTIAIAASYGNTPGGQISSNGTAASAVASYLLQVDGTMDVRIVAEDSDDILSSVSSEYSGSANFGSLAVLGDDMDEKIVVLRPGHYGITLRGTRTGKGKYSLKSISGLKAQEKEIQRESINVHPEAILYLDVRDGKCAKTDLSWDPLDHTATDPFTGEPTRGSQTAAGGRLTGGGSLYSWVEKAANTGDKIPKNAYVHVLAEDPGTKMLLISCLNDQGILTRGWVKPGSIKADGYVPKLVRDDPVSLTVSAGPAWRAPTYASAEAAGLKKDTGATLIHAEYDTNGEEWAYVLLDGNGKRSAVYVPSSRIAGWTPVAPTGFRIAREMPVPVWRTTLGGNGYTEVMWVASQWDGSGVAVSGRTTSKSGNVKAKYGERDALAALIDPDGKIESAVTDGGSGNDSYHCIVPTEDGFFVSGITRSNDKGFAGTWDTDSFSGKTNSKTQSSNALIGRLNPDLSIRWMKSFGNGASNQSNGFDMVLRMGSGVIAGFGWMRSEKNFQIKTNGGHDFFAVLMTEDGDTLAMNHFGGYEQDVPDSAAVTADGGLVMVGNKGGDKEGKAQVIFADGNLNQTGQITYGGKGANLFDNVRDLGDGTYLATGYTTGYGHGGMDFWAMRIDGQGRTLWQKTYGGSKDEELRGTLLMNNGMAVLLGDTESTDGDVLGSVSGGKNAWAVCIDMNGRMVWQYTEYISNNNWFNSAAVDPDDGSLVLGGVCSQKGENARGLLVKVQIPAAGGTAGAN